VSLAKLWVNIILGEKPDRPPISPNCHTGFELVC
jgi:hypothetical protein